MARPNQPAPGARDGTARPGDSPDNASSRDEAAVEDTSAATPKQVDIIPEPFNPNFLDRNADNTEVGSGVPGLGNADENRVTVETTGEFMLQDPYTLDLVPASGSASVRNTSFIQEKLLAGQLKEA